MKCIWYYLGLLALNAAAVCAKVRCPTQMNLTGHIDPDQVMTFVYEPIDVPPGVSSLSVSYSYSGRGAGNALDIGIFDQRGSAMPNPSNGTFGSRGWSGGFRDSFTITNSWATPGYNAGPISPGTWYIVFGPYSSVEAGIDWNAHVELSFSPTAAEDWYETAYASSSFEPAPFWATKEPRTEPRWLRGDFHLHTVHSDGRYLPEEQISNAVNRKLDFMFFSEHNTYSGNDVYGLYQPEQGSILIGRAIEVTTRHGHWNGIGLDRGQNIDWRYHPDDGDDGYPAAAAQVHRAGGLVSVNHPFATCGRCDWGLSWDHNDAIEVWNGPWDETDQLAVERWHDYLVAGRRYAAIGGSDAHRSPDVTGLPTTVVLSAGLTQSDIVDGARRGFAYMVKEPEMQMELSLEDVKGNSFHVGQAVSKKAVSGSEAKLTLKGFGSDAITACWISESGYKSNVTVESGKDSLKFAAGDVSNFLRVEIRDRDGYVLGLTNPLFLE